MIVKPPLIRVVYAALLVLFCWPGQAEEVVLVCRKSGQAFDTVAQSLRREVAEIRFVDFIMEESATGRTSYSAFVARVREVKPSSLVLMDNLAVAYAERLAKEANPGMDTVRGVATMGLNLKASLKSSKRFCGVAYEVPVYSVVTQYRRLVKHSVKRVLLIYRKSDHQQVVADAREHLAGEGIELVAVDAEQYGTRRSDIETFFRRRFLRHLRDNIDVVCVLPDNLLITQSTLSQYWQRGAATYRIPFISAFQPFVEPRADFCVYAAIPDYEALGYQVGDQLYNLMQGRSAAQLGIEYLLSTRRCINLRKLNSLGVELRDDVDLSDGIIYK